MDKAKGKDLDRAIISLLREADVVDDDETVDKSQFVGKLTILLTTITELKNTKRTSARVRVQLSEKQNEIQDLEETLEQKVEEYEALETQLSALEAKIRRLEDTINQKEEEKREAQSKTLEAQRKANMLAFEKENLLMSTQDVEKRTGDLAEENERQMEEVNFLKERMRALENHLSTVKLKTDQFRKETNTKLEKTNSEVKAFSDENTKLRKEVTTMQKEAKALNNLSVDTMRSGWLNKQSPNETFGKKVQKRWVVLNGIKVDYYKSEKQDEKPLGTITLDQCKIATMPDDESMKKFGHNFLIELTQENGKVTTFFASSKQEKKEWMDAIKANKMRHVARADRATSVRGLPPKRPTTSVGP